MADPTLGQGSALNKPLAPQPSASNDFLRRARAGWKFGRCWIRYRLAGARCGVPGLADLVLENPLLTAMQVPSELAALGEILAAHRPECALEIGTALGGALLFLCKLASPSAIIVSVDLPGDKFGGGYSARRRWAYQRFARRSQKLCLLQGDSHSRAMLTQVKGTFGNRPLDYLFIDGDHSYPGVKSDFEMYGAMVRKGGIIAFHDIVEGVPENVGRVPQLGGGV